MRKSTKMLATTGMAITLVVPNVAMATEKIENNSNININLEKRTVLLGDKSKISVSFKEKQNANSITLNYLCYDMPLSTTLNYNEQTDSYEGEINFNKDPEYLNVWEIENITINSDTEKVLSSTDLQNLGLNLDDYKVTQEYIVTTPKSLATYLQKSAAPVKKLVGDNRQDTAVEISKEGWANGSSKVILVNGNAIADGITATPLATTYDAPILLANKDNIPTNTLEEIKRLNPSEIIVVGGETVISNNAMNNLKQNISTNNVRRLAGINRYETSLKIAQEIDNNHDVNKIYIANGYKGEVDALTIAAKAGQDKQPIILSEKTNIPTSTYNWLKNENLTDAYFIGGENVITTDVIHQIAEITKPAAGQSVYRNRVYGTDRHETNAKVIERFYTQADLDSVLVAKSDVLVDALAAGPLAAKLNSPILINPTTYVSNYHQDNLSNKSAKLVYQVGGGINDNVINDIAYKLSERNLGNHTVVIDPGHGGADSGAENQVNKNIKEKDYTLDTSLASAQYLRDSGVNVVLTRDKDVTTALGSRTDLANSINPDLLVSVHFNSYNTQGKGSEIYYKYKDRNGGTSKTAATNILNSILEKFNFSNRGIKTRLADSGADYYHMIRESVAPSVIVESSFIDNEQDQLLVNTLEKRKNLGIQIGKGIEKTVKN
ncbi:cell wall-binding repeat-containing protein [Romboutsia sedimentorum]|uniref:cell wall-binding repeat-containing protein n=1 Tax=Romboutsia sedimentorum TaxID=1368474 RepID=UPI0024DDFA96|nr:cell wall-binding repeat-containing protein [Romboutsia sedimentorum]MDK2586307.1 cell wall-binding repeat-containing protein [Romboutsia sedimentorum]